MSSTRDISYQDHSMDQSTAPPHADRRPATLDRGLLRRLRVNAAKLAERDRKVREANRKRAAHAIATTNTGRTLYDHSAQSIPTETEIHQAYAQPVQQFGTDLVILRGWLEERARTHARTVATKRVAVASKLRADYAVPERMQSLAAAAAQMLCYRVGFPLLLTQEQRGYAGQQLHLWAIDDPG
jgi:hypothetical protein